MSRRTTSRAQSPGRREEYAGPLETDDDRTRDAAIGRKRSAVGLVPWLALVVIVAAISWIFVNKRADGPSAQSLGAGHRLSMRASAHGPDDDLDPSVVQLPVNELSAGEQAMLQRLAPPRVGSAPAHRGSVPSQVARASLAMLPPKSLLQAQAAFAPPVVAPPAGPPSDPATGGDSEATAGVEDPPNGDTDGENATSDGLGATASAGPDLDTGADETAAFESSILNAGGGVPVHVDGEFRSPFANPKIDAIEVRVGLLLGSIPSYDIQSGSFEADFFVSFTSEKPMPTIRLSFANGHANAEDCRVLADLPTFKLYRFVGVFLSPPDLRLYPFDTQDLEIAFEDDFNGVDMLKFKPDVERTFLDDGFSIPGWDVSYMRARSMSHYYPDRFDNDDLYYHRYIFAIGITRFATSAMFTVFVPAIVIVLISLSGLWFPRDDLDVRSNATTPMLAAAVLFHFALTQSLPAVAYLTRADKLMLSVYACLGLHMVSSWLWFVFDEKHTQRIFVLSKAIGAPLTIIVLLMGILL